MACVNEREKEIEKDFVCCVCERDGVNVCLFPLTVMRIMIIATDHWGVLYVSV